MMLRQLPNSTRLPVVHPIETPIFTRMSNYFCNFSHIISLFFHSALSALSSSQGVYS